MIQIGKIAIGVLAAGALAGGGYLLTDQLLGKQIENTSESVKGSDNSNSDDKVVEPKPMSYAGDLDFETREKITEDMQKVFVEKAKYDGMAVAKFNVVGARDTGFFVSQTSNGTVMLEKSVPDNISEEDAARLPKLKEEVPQSPITAGVFVVFKSTDGETGLMNYDNGPTAMMYHDFPEGNVTSYLLGPDAVLYEGEMNTKGTTRINPWTYSMDGTINAQSKKSMTDFQPTEDKELQDKYQEILEKYVEK